MWQKAYRTHRRKLFISFLVSIMICLVLVSETKFVVAQQPLLQLSTGIERFFDIAWSNNGQWLAIASSEGEVRPSFWTVAIRSRKTEENWEIIENGTAKKTDIQRGI